MSREAVEQKLSEFEGLLHGDEHVFHVVDLRLPQKDQKVVPVVGNHAEGFIKNNHYYVTYAGENSSSKQALRDRDIARIKKEFGEIAMPKSPSDLLAERDAELSELKAQMADPNAEIEKLKAQLAEATAKNKSGKAKAEPKTEAEGGIDL